MNPFRNDARPRYAPPPDVMSCDEIRWWMRELVDRRGWNRGELQRGLGMPTHNYAKMLGKQWIYPGEQIRFSRQLRKIISGEVVLKETTRRTKGRRFVRDPVRTSHPVPLRMPMRLTFDFRAGRLRITPERVAPENPLPVFGKLLDNPPKRWM